MIILFGMWILMAGAAVACGIRFPLRTAVAVWAGLAAAACALGGLLLHLQPIGVATPAGRIGGSVVRFGFEASRGRLAPAIGISWLIWTLIGAAVIGATQHRAQPRHLFMILAWAVDVGALFHVLGLVAINRGSSGTMVGSLLTMALIVVGLLVVSAFLWTSVGTGRARALALLVAGGPPLFLGLGYGLMLAAMLLGENLVALITARRPAAGGRRMIPRGRAARHAA